MKHVSYICPSREEYMVLIPGESTSRSFVIEFNLGVCLSSLCYLAVAAIYAIHSHVVMASLFLAVTVCSVFADSVAPSSAMWNSLDRVVATFTTALAPVRTIVWPGVACAEVRLSTACFTAMALSLLFWSRESKTMSHYAWRHSAWHIFSALTLSWLADVTGRGALQQPLWGPIIARIVPALGNSTLS